MVFFYSLMLIGVSPQQFLLVQTLSPLDLIHLVLKLLVAHLVRLPSRWCRCRDSLRGIEAMSRLLLRLLGRSPGPFRSLLFVRRVDELSKVLGWRPVELPERRNVR